jgi:2-hydroxy-6-oxo-octa-2,4-dienoate hydrolase
MVKGFPEEALRKIGVPTLVVHGREDAVVPPDCGLLIARNVPNADFHLFGRCGHWVHLEARDRFMPLARSFLSPFPADRRD